MRGRRRMINEENNNNKLNKKKRRRNTKFELMIINENKIIKKIKEEKKDIYQ